MSIPATELLGNLTDLPVRVFLLHTRPLVSLDQGVTSSKEGPTLLQISFTYEIFLISIKKTKVRASSKYSIVLINRPLLIVIRA